MLEAATAEAARRAESNPFELPFGTYRYCEDHTESLVTIEAGRKPVLALGNEAMPGRLAWRFRSCPDGIPVTRAIVYDHVAVFAAAFDSHGNLATCLLPYRGAACVVSVTWLTDDQIQEILRSDGPCERTSFVSLDRVAVDDVAGPIPSVGVQIVRAGLLAHDGSPIRSAEVPATGCPLPALTQHAAMRWVQPRLALGLDFPTFARRLAEDASFRRASNVALRRLALPGGLDCPTAPAAPAVALAR
ncbi:MAG: hypothetical protein U1E14_09605 [Geminicoccaceae bacterium]